MKKHIYIFRQKKQLIDAQLKNKIQTIENAFNVPSKTKMYFKKKNLYLKRVLIKNPNINGYYINGQFISKQNKLCYKN